MKKLLSLMLAMMMLVLPALSLAATPDEMFENAALTRPMTMDVSFVPGNLPVPAEAATIINDLLKAMSFRVQTQTGETEQTNFSLMLDNKDCLNFAFATEGDTVYVKSNLLGDKAIAATQGEEMTKLLDRMVDLMVQADMISKRDAADMKAQLGAMAGGFNAPQADFDVNSFDASGLIPALSGVLQKVVVEDVTGQAKNFDPATQKMTITLTAEDMVAIYDAIFTMLKSNPEFMAYMAANLEGANLQVDGKPMTFAEMLDTFQSEIKENLPKMLVGDVPVVVYLNEAGEPVAITASMTMKEDDDQIRMDVNYTRLTVAAGVAHSVNLTSVEADGGEEDGVGITFDIVIGETQDTFKLAAVELDAGVAEDAVLTADGTITKNYGDTESAETIDMTMTIYDDGESMGLRFVKDAKAVLTGEDVAYTGEVAFYLQGMNDALFTMVMNGSTGEAAPSIVDADALRPGAMNDDQFSAWCNSVMNSLQTALITLLQNLPASILQLLMG